MRLLRWSPVAVLVLLAVVLALAAHDALSWRSTLDRGDARLTSRPASAQWRASTLLPGDPTRSLLALDDDLALRRAVRAFLVAEATPRGFDNGVTRTITPTGPFELQHVRLTREAWREGGRTAEVTGVEACLPWFGISPGIS